MALAIDSIFRHIIVDYSPTDGEVTRVTWVLEDNTLDDVDIGGPSNSWRASSELDILQDIFELDTPFPDTNGNPLDITVQGFPGGDTIEDLENAGIMNPLDRTSIERHDNRQEVEGALFRHASVEEDSVSERRDIVTTGGIRPKRGVPPSGTAEVSMRDWFAEYVSSGTFRFRLNDPGGIDNARVLAMVQLLIDRKVSGPDILASGVDSLDDIDDVADFLLGNRNYDINQLDGALTGSQVVKFSVTQYGYGPLSFQITCAAIAGSYGFSISRLTEMFRGLTVEVPTTGEYDEPPLGNDEQPGPVFADQVVFPDQGELRPVNEYPTWQSSAGHTTLGGPYGRIITHVQTDRASGDDYRTIDWDDHALIYNARAIHLSGGSAFDYNVLRLDYPRNMVPNQGESYDFDIVNDNDTESVTVQDVDGNTILVLRPGHVLPLRFNWDPSDDEEIISRVPVIRTYEYSREGTAAFNSVNYFEHPDTNRRVRADPVPRGRRSPTSSIPTVSSGPEPTAIPTATTGPTDGTCPRASRCFIPGGSVSTASSPLGREAREVCRTATIRL